MKRLLTLFAVLFHFVAVEASHVSGGDISFTWVGPGPEEYLITLNLFRDCDGIGMSTTETIDATSSCGGNITISLPLTNPGGTEISQLCAADQSNSTCNGGSLPGMQLYTYQAVVNLSPACNSWTFGWSTCCRNNTVNVPSSSSDNIYLEATMNSITGPQNNSPAYTSQPIPYVCVNQPVNYNYGVVEPDGDSLVFSLIGGYTGSGASLTYGGGYSGLTPIAGITINTVNGNINFTPTILGNFIVVVQTEEYDDNGNLLSVVMRDIQFVVMNCFNQVPDINSGQVSNINGNAIQTGPYAIELCEGNSFQFTAVYTDPDIGDTMHITSNMGTVLTNSSYTFSGTNPLTVVYSWTVPAGAAGQNTTFVTTITDGNCPVSGIQTYVYDIHVLDRTLAGPDQTICGTQTAQLNASGGNVFTWYDLSGNLIPVTPAFSCNPCDNPVAHPTTSTTYVVESDLTGTCINRDTVTIFVSADFTYTLTQSNTSACLFQPIQLACTPNPPGAYNYFWTPASIMSNPNISNPVLSAIQPGVYDIHTTVISPTGCVKIDSMQVTITQNAAPVVTAVSDTVCLGDVNQLNVDFLDTSPTTCGINPVLCASPSLVTVGTGNQSNTSTTYPSPYGNWYKNTRHQFLFLASELLAAGVVPGKISSMQFQVSSNTGTTTYPNFEIKMGCTSLNSLPTGSFQTGLNTVYTVPTYSVISGWNSHPFNQAFEWDGVSNIIVDVCNSLTANYTNNAVVMLTPTTFTSSIWYNSDVTSACPNNSSFGSASQRPNVKFGNCTVAPNPANYSYQWSPSATVTNNAIINPQTIVPNGGTYTVIVTDLTGGCADTSTVTIVNSGVPLNPTINIPSQTFYCINDPSFVLSGVTPGGTWAGAGMTAATGVFSPLAAGIGNHLITYTLSSSAYCVTVDTLFLDVVSSPNASIATANNIQICQNSAGYFYAPVVPGGVWSGPGIDPVSGYFDPALAGAGTHDIVYTLGSGNCIEDDTVQVMVMAPPDSSLVQAGPFCEDDAAFALQAATPGGVWSGTGVNSALGTFDPGVANPGMYPITYTYNNVCTFSSFMTVVVKPNPTQPIMTNDGPHCEFQQLTFTTTTIQNAMYSWTGPNGFTSADQNPVITPTNVSHNGDYFLTITVNGCSSTPGQTNVIIYPTPPTPVVSNNSPVCEGSNLLLFTDAFNGATYLWSGPNGFTATTAEPVIAYALAGHSGDYHVIKEANGCVSEQATTTVTVNPVPVANFAPNPEEADMMDPTVEFINLSTTGINYSWDFGDNESSISFSPIHVYNDTGTYIVHLQVVDMSTGCENEHVDTVLISPYHCVFIPKAFTPNADGRNDEFQIKGQDFEAFQLQIFDRWGGLLFESDNPARMWNGNVPSGEAPAGAYVYRLKVKGKLSDTKEFVGSVNLYR